MAATDNPEPKSIYGTWKKAFEGKETLHITEDNFIITWGNGFCERCGSRIDKLCGYFYKVRHRAGISYFTYMDNSDEIMEVNATDRGIWVFVRDPK